MHSLIYARRGLQALVRQHRLHRDGRSQGLVRACATNAVSCARASLIWFSPTTFRQRNPKGPETSIAKRMVVCPPAATYSCVVRILAPSRCAVSTRTYGRTSSIVIFTFGPPFGFRTNAAPGFTSPSRRVYSSPLSHLLQLLTSVIAR